MFYFRSFMFILCLTIVFSEILEDIDLDCDTVSEPRFRRAIKTSGKSKKTASTECLTPICKSTTSQMLAAMNHHADACEEFQELVCGNKIQINGFTMENLEVLENYINTKITYTSEKFLQDFKRFYESCVHYSIDFNFLKNLDFIKTSSAIDVTEAFVESILMQSMPFFDVGLDIGATDESYQFLLTLPGESYLKTHTLGWSILDESQRECIENIQDTVGSKTIDLDKMYSEYRKCKEEMLFKYAENFETTMKFTNKMADNEALLKEPLELYQKNLPLEEIIRSSKNSRTLTEMTINELEGKYGVIDWKLFFQKITANKTFTGDEKVLVAFPAHMQNIFDDLKKIDAGKLTKMIQELTSLNLYHNLLTTKAINKKLYCMDLAQQLMPDVVSCILYDLSPAKKIFLAVYQSNKIFADLKDMLKKSFEDSSLDDMSKEKFVKKLDRLNLGVITSGDTNTTRDNYKLVKVRENYQENVVTLLKNYRNFLYNVVGSKSSPATLLNFFVSGFSTKPMTFYTSDSIVLHPEIYKKIPVGMPEQIRYAKLGFSLAQAIAKHFDTTGRLFMTNDIRSNDNYYQELITHMTELFDDYYVKTPYNFHKSILKFKPVTSKEFANEMIVDNAAFRLITDYFGKVKKLKDLPWILNGSITLNQTFFIAAAQEFCDDQSEASFMRDFLEKRHLPYQIKIRNIVSNSEFFSKSFSCVQGSSLWLDPSIIRQFPQAPDEYEDGGQTEGQYED